LTLSGDTLSGTLTATGTFIFTITATDDNGCQGSREYTVNISPPSCPTITVSPATLPGGILGDIYNQMITASGGDGPYTFDLVNGALPLGLDLTPEGQLSGTLAQAFTFNFTIRATDSNGCQGLQEYTILVCPGIILETPAGNLPDGFLGQPYSTTITSSDPDAVYERVGDLPPGLSGTIGSYVISGIPTQAGTWEFTINATTTLGCNDSRVYRIRVLGTSSIPTLSEWGMIIMALALVSISLIVIRRQQAAV
jgi:hypothetical protein